MELTRRKFLASLALVSPMTLGVGLARADSGEGGSGNSGSGGSGGTSGSGSGGGGNSGPGGGGGNDDGGNDDGGDDSNGGSSSGSGSSSTGGSPSSGVSSSGNGASDSGNKVKKFLRMPVVDQQEAKQAIQAGRASSMSLLLTFVKQNYPGMVLDVKMRGTSGNYVYEVRYLADTVMLRTIFLDARSLRKL